MWYQLLNRINNDCYIVKTSINTTWQLLYAIEKTWQRFLWFKLISLRTHSGLLCLTHAQRNLLLVTWTQQPFRGRVVLDKYHSLTARTYLETKPHTSQHPIHESIHTQIMGVEGNTHSWCVDHSSLRYSWNIGFLHYVKGVAYRCSTKCVSVFGVYKGNDSQSLVYNAVE